MYSQCSGGVYRLKGREGLVALISPVVNKIIFHFKLPESIVIKIDDLTFLGCFHHRHYCFMKYLNLVNKFCWLYPNNN